jgi:ABC-2 type transport system permease protein
MRLIFSMMFPLIFIGVLGQSLNSNLGGSLQFDLLTFTFLGVLAQTLFQSTTSGLISLVADRENDFAQEMFVSPISRYSIIFGKILGESIVSFLLIISILAIGLVLRIPIDWVRLILVLPAGFIACFLGGAFGTLVMSGLSGQQSAQQVFPFLIFPQIFLAGVFSPITNLPPVLFVLSRIAPMTYAIDFMRGLYYWGKPEYAVVTLYSPLTNLIVISLMFSVFLFFGTYFFVKKDQER